MSDLATVIEDLIRKTVNDALVRVVNVSHLHSGHSGYKKNGQSHFDVYVESEELNKLKPIERHKILNSAVEDLLKTDKIHAISFKKVAKMQ